MSLSKNMQIMQVKKYIYVINSVPPASGILWWPCIGKPAKFHLEALVWSWDLGSGTTRTLNPHMVFMWFPHGFHVVCTCPHMVFMWFAHGLNMSLTWFSCGFHMEALVWSWDLGFGTTSTLPPHMIFMWFPYGLCLFRTWFAHGLHMDCTWFADGLHIVCTWFAHCNPSIHPRTLIGTWTKQILADLHEFEQNMQILQVYNTFL